MTIKIIGTSSGVEVDTDTNNNVLICEGVPSHVGGGHFTMTSGFATVIGVSLGTDSTLGYMQYFGKGPRAAYLTKFVLRLGSATVGASTLVPGAIGLMRFSNLTLAQTFPTLNRQDTQSIKSDVVGTSSNAAITMTGAVFGNEIARTRIPIFFNLNNWYEWKYEPTYPTVLYAYDGIAMRTRVACPATQTWLLAYEWHWYEA